MKTFAKILLVLLLFSQPACAIDWDLYHQYYNTYYQIDAYSPLGANYKFRYVTLPVTLDYVSFKIYCASCSGGNAYLTVKDPSGTTVGTATASMPTESYKWVTFSTSIVINDNSCCYEFLLDADYPIKYYMMADIVKLAGGGTFGPCDRDTPALEVIKSGSSDHTIDPTFRMAYH